MNDDAQRQQPAPERGGVSSPAAPTFNSLRLSLSSPRMREPSGSGVGPGEQLVLGGGNEAVPFGSAPIPPGVLWTGRYQSWQPEHGRPIRTTVGAPKWWTSPPLIQCRSVTPYGVFGREFASADEMQAAYVAKLDRTAASVVGELVGLVRRFPGERLVLLCFDDVRAGVACHRRWFAVWWETLFDVPVREA
jgi:hypothetical protein